MLIRLYTAMDIGDKRKRKEKAGDHLALLAPRQVRTSRR
jgi:hypothetical protein